MTLEMLKRTLAEASQVFILTDEHVAEFWLPELIHWLDCDDARTMVIKPGEAQKSLRTARRVWDWLLKKGADRQAVLINFGGGVVSDLGGFVASCYQRGIRFVNVPTTLLSMVDAAIGGKNGVDLGGFKNQIGTFADPLEVVVNPIVLSTLPERELLSGMAEMVKYGFIADPAMLKVDHTNYEQYILRAGRIKRELVDRDFKEQGVRKLLNFGHTLGHALESFSHGTARPFTHGEAVAMGMWCALWISMRQCQLPESVLHEYEPTLATLLSLANPTLDGVDMESILRCLVHDKKSKDGKLRWVLLPAVGAPIYDQPVSEELVRQSVCELIDFIRKNH